MTDKSIFKPPSPEEAKKRMTTRWNLIGERLKSIGRPNADGTYDFYGYVDISHLNLKNIEADLSIRFGSVYGGFDCSSNNLEVFDGCPYHVGGDFDCRNNRFKSLDGFPKHVGVYVFFSNGFFTREQILKVCDIAYSNIIM